MTAALLKCAYWNRSGAMRQINTNCLQNISSRFHGRSTLSSLRMCTYRARGKYGRKSVFFFNFFFFKYFFFCNSTGKLNANFKLTIDAVCRKLNEFMKWVIEMKCFRMTISKEQRNSGTRWQKKNGNILWLQSISIENYLAQSILICINSGNSIETKCQRKCPLKWNIHVTYLPFGNLWPGHESRSINLNVGLNLNLFKNNWFTKRPNF